MNPRDYSDLLLERLTGAIAAGDFKLVAEIIENEPEENIRKAAGRLAPGVTSEKLAAGRAFIFGVLAEKSSQRLRDSLTNVGKKIDFLASGLDAVNGSIKGLDESSARLGRRAVWVAVVVGTFTLVQAVAAAIQIWKWMKG